MPKCVRTVAGDYCGIRCEEDHGMVAFLDRASLVYIRELKQQRRKKESVYIRKEFNSYRICLEHQHGRHFIVWPPLGRVKTLDRRLSGNWGRVSKQTVRRVTNMIQFGTLIYFFRAIFRLELNEQNVNLLVKRAACDSLCWSLGRTPFLLCCPNGTINLSSVNIKFNARFDTVLVTNEWITFYDCQNIKYSIDVDINSAYLKLDFLLLYLCKLGSLHCHFL